MNFTAFTAARAAKVFAAMALLAAGWVAGANSQSSQGGKVELGQFSVSLAVKDLKKSQEFYEKFGFARVAGMKPTDPIADGKGWVILQNGGAVIGLFQGLFEGNILTFNPLDVRAVKAALAKNGVQMELQNMYGPLTETSPAYAVLKDPDGNSIMLDQHGPTK